MKLERMRELREEKGLTQTELANYLEVTQKTYSRYENDERSIPLEKLILLADFYQTTLDYLVGRSDQNDLMQKLELYVLGFCMLASIKCNSGGNRNI